jgi:hypothetical protein
MIKSSKFYKADDNHVSIYMTYLFNVNAYALGIHGRFLAVMRGFHEEFECRKQN